MSIKEVITLNGRQLLQAIGVESAAAKGGLIAVTVVVVLIAAATTGWSARTTLALALVFMVTCICAVPTMPVSLVVTLTALALGVASLIVRSGRSRK